MLTDWGQGHFYNMLEWIQWMTTTHFVTFSRWHETLCIVTHHSYYLTSEGWSFWSRFFLNNWTFKLSEIQHLNLRTCKVFLSKCWRKLVFCSGGWVDCLILSLSLCKGQFHLSIFWQKPIFVCFLNRKRVIWFMGQKLKCIEGKCTAKWGCFVCFLNT